MSHTQFQSSSTTTNQPGASPVRQMSSIRQRLATSGRILIVDDNPRVGALIKGGLRDSYHVVEHIADPKAALEKIVRAKARGKAYDAVVLDLLMPEMDGLTLLSKLGQNLTTVVIHTASTMATEVLDLSGKISGQDGLERIFVHHKSPGTINILREKIDNAVLHFESEKVAAIRFYETYRPRLKEKEPGLEEVHNFCEEARNLSEELTNLLKYLRDEHCVAQTAWWNSAAREKLEAAIKTLGKARQSDIWKSTPGATDSNLHDLLNIMALELEAPTVDQLPELTKSKQTGKLLEQWRETVEQYYKVCKALRSGFKVHYSKTFFLEDFLPEILPAGLPPNIEYLGAGHEPQERRGVVDPERRVRNLLKGLCQTFKEVTSQTPESEPGIVTHFLPEEIRTGEELTLRRKLQKIECGSYWEITLSADGIDLEKSFEKLAPALAQTIENKECFIEVSKIGSRSYFTLYLKSSAPTLNLEKVEKESAKEMLKKKEDGSYKIPKDRKGNGLWVQEGLGTKGNLVCVFSTPLKRGDKMHDGPLLYSDGASIIYCNSFGHPISAKTIVQYLKHIHHGKAEYAWLLKDDATEKVYRKALRVNITRDGVFNVDAFEDSSEAKLAIDVLTQLGLPPQRIMIDRGDFCRKLDPSWFAQERRIESSGRI